MAATGLKLGKIAQPVRVALTGRTASPGIFEITEIIGKEARSRACARRSRTSKRGVGVTERARERLRGKTCTILIALQPSAVKLSSYHAGASTDVSRGERKMALTSTTASVILL